MASLVVHPIRYYCMILLYDSCLVERGKVFLAVCGVRPSGRVDARRVSVSGVHASFHDQPSCCDVNRYMYDNNM